MLEKQLTYKQFTEYMDDFAQTVNEGFNQMQGQFNELKQGQENISLRLSNVAYRFELEELKEKIRILEEKAGIPS